MKTSTSKVLVLLVFLASITQCKEVEQVDTFSWTSFIENNEREAIKRVLPKMDNFEVQIRYTQIDRDESQIPTFTPYDLNLEPSIYFYPASTVKMPVAALAIQKINELREEYPALSIYSTMKVDSVAAYQTAAQLDSTSKTGFPSIAHYIKKLFVVSDNNAYNRLYEFLGQDYINQELKEKGVFSNSRVVSRVGVGQLSREENAFTNPVAFLDAAGNVIYDQFEKRAQGNYLQGLRNSVKGRGFYSDELDSVILQPFDFSEKNFINLNDLEASLKRIVFPEAFSEEERFNLSDEDYKFLRNAMGAYPSDYSFYADDAELNYDSYVKFFMFGDSKTEIPDHIHIYNKVGFAYGYLTDCAYIFDTKNDIEFLLSATIHVNENQIYNDGQYEYDEIGLPFLAELGRQIYEFELSRE